MNPDHQPWPSSGRSAVAVRCGGEWGREGTTVTEQDRETTVYPGMWPGGDVRPERPLTGTEAEICWRTWSGIGRRSS